MLVLVGLPTHWGCWSPVVEKMSELAAFLLFGTREWEIAFIKRAFHSGMTLDIINIEINLRIKPNNVTKCRLLCFVCKAEMFGML